MCAIINGVIMGRKKKDAIVLNMKCDRKVMESLREYCAVNKIDRTRAVEMMIATYINALPESKKDQYSKKF